MTMLCLSLSVTTAHHEVYSKNSLLEMVRSTNCEEKIEKHCKSEHFISFKLIPLGIFSNQLNKNDIQHVYGYFILVKTINNGFIIYFLLKIILCEKNDEKHIKNCSWCTISK